LQQEQADSTRRFICPLQRSLNLFTAPDPAMHAEQFKIVNMANNEELANVGS